MTRAGQDRNVAASDPKDTTMPPFDPSQTNSIYDRLSPGWRANQDFAEMLPHVLAEGRYLDEFGGATREAPGQYALRKRMSVALDLCQDLVDLRVDNLFRIGPVREFSSSPFAAEIERFCDDVDGAGTSLDAFMRRAARAMYVNGVDIVVDRRPDRPYLSAFGPLERPDWACDDAGRYLWVRYDLGSAPPGDEDEPAPPLRRFLTLTRDGWRLHAAGEAGSADLDTSSGPHALGVCPVVSFYYRTSNRPEMPKVPLSLLTRLTPIARFLLNLVSQGQLDLYLTVAFFIATGVGPEEVPEEMGAATCWALPNPEAKIHHAVLGCEHIAEKRQWLSLALEAMLRIGKVAGLAGLSASSAGRATSGIQVAVERTELDNELRATAAEAERVEKRIVQLAISRLHPPAGGGVIPLDRLGYDVQYNKEYVLTPAIDLVRQVRELVDSGVHQASPSLLRLQLRKLLTTLSRRGDIDYQAALDELRQASLGELGATGL